MRSLFHRSILAAALSLAALTALAATAATAAATPPAVESFFSRASISAVQLSPDGRYAAFRINNGTERDGLAVVNLESNAVNGVARFSDVDIGQFQWVNNQRLVFDTVDRNQAPGAVHYAPGMYAANRDGSDLRQLVERATYARDTTGTNIRARVLPYNTYLLPQDGAQNSDSVYVRRANFNEVRNEVKSYDLLRLNTVTGAVETLGRPGDVQDWLLDQDGVPRLAVTEEAGRSALHYLDPAHNNWRQLASFATYGLTSGVFHPVGFGANGKLYVTAQAGADKRSLRTYDLASSQLDKEALIELADYDFSGELVYSQGRMLGVELLSDARGMTWLDPAMAKVQQAVDALLPNTSNLLRPPKQPQSPWVLVSAFSDKQPVLYLVYNTETKVLNKLGSAHPAIDPARMAQQDLHRVKARDGLVIPTWLTLPKGSEKQAKPQLPMVVLVHGGPFVRGEEWGWDAQAQFLASRGYAVLQPEFRGSTGFGARHFRAGWKQWGLAMQDDVADATRWAVAQGIADPKRICIAGASYGGYATLMGLVNDAQLYRCGVSWAGVTDLAMLAGQGNRFVSDMGDSYRQFGLPVLVGDPVRDADRFKATSPLQQAGRVTRPVLLAHGSADRRVPIAQAKAFYNAVKAGNPEAELVIYDDEGHGWSLPQTQFDFWGRVETFLNKHIGPAAKAE
jgi:dipeptidyl aminopeptidase/acylaminoacyl peptidase